MALRLVYISGLVAAVRAMFPEHANSGVCNQVEISGPALLLILHLFLITRGKQPDR
jgi:hypothetical protein